MSPTAYPPPPEVFSEVLDGAVREILDHEDPDRLFDWLRGELSRDDRREALGLRDDADARALAQAFGRGLWNAMPLPGNDFRPKPLPSPGRNDTCPCGSGRKFKRCCGISPAPPPFGSDEVWPLVLGRMPAKTRREAIAAGKAPITALIGVASELFDDGEPGNARDMLEPAFAGKIHGQGEEYDYGLNLLCNIYDELGHTNKKKALLQRIVDETRRSPLRSGALQRFASIKMDAGDREGAWADFQAAQRDDPKSPAIGLLEVQLLLSEARPERARERARFWAKRLRNQGFRDEEDGPVAFLEAIARDPYATMADVGIDIAGGAGRRLLEWLQQVGARALPDYRVADEPPTFLPDAGSGDAGAGEGLDKSGELDDTDEHEALRNLAEERRPAAADDDDSLFLLAPPSVSALERDWHAVFPLPKPFSVQRTTFADEDAWDLHEEDGWMTFLEAHPEAFDSLDILDDLATAVEEHPQRETAGIGAQLLGPVLERARAIVERALSTVEQPQLHWGWSENRPALRSLVRLAYLRREHSNEREATEVAQTVLALNPYDNHGIRALVINGRLRAGENERAVELARQYPDDLHPDLSYGEALGLFRLERHDEAQAALDRAVEALPRVPRLLIAERVRQPRLDPFGIKIGGDDQAWLYREEMREVWSVTPGAMEWLRGASRRRKRTR